MAQDQPAKPSRRRNTPAAKRIKVDYEQVLRNVTVRVIVADRDLRIIYMNAASEKTFRELEHLLPCRADEMVGQCIDIFHRNPEHQRRLLANPRNLPHRAEIRLGPEILELNASPLYNDEGTLFGMMVNWDLITERKHLEARQADLIAQIEAIGRTNLVIEFEPDGRIITANDNFLNATGYSLTELKGQHHRILCDDQLVCSSEYRDMWTRLQRGEYISGDFPRKSRDGRTVWLRAAYNAIRDSAGQVIKVVKFATDLTSHVTLRHATIRLEPCLLHPSDSAAH